jgi:hypothetical protein
MRIAVISDIHSNIEALTEVLRVAEHQKVDRFVVKNAEVLEESLGTDLSGGYPGGLGIQYYNCWGEDSGHPIGEFCFGPSILHGRQYYGCYYSPDDEPRGFQSVEVTLVPDGENCWTWRAEGDNRGMTKKIQDRWYYFEAWL